jgi:hypothetical protein
MGDSQPAVERDESESEKRTKWKKKACIYE